MSSPGNLGGLRTEDPLRNVDLHRMQAPCADTAEQERVAELVLAGHHIGDVTERPVVRQDPVGRAGVHHAGKRVMPQILLVCGARRVRVGRRRVLAHEVSRMPATDPGRLHPSVRGEVCRPEREALHPRARPGDLLDVGDTARGLQNRVDEQRPGESRLRLELGEQTVDVVDVLRALDLGHHDDIQLVTDRRDEGQQVVEAPR